VWVVWYWWIWWVGIEHLHVAVVVAVLDRGVRIRPGMGLGGDANGDVRDLNLKSRAKLPYLHTHYEGWQLSMH